MEKQSGWVTKTSFLNWQKLKQYFLTCKSPPHSGTWCTLLQIRNSISYFHSMLLSSATTWLSDFSLLTHFTSLICIHTSSSSLVQTTSYPPGSALFTHPPPNMLSVLLMTLCVLIMLSYLIQLMNYSWIHVHAGLCVVSCPYWHKTVQVHYYMLASTPPHSGAWRIESKNAVVQVILLSYHSLPLVKTTYISLSC